MEKEPCMAPPVEKSLSRSVHFHIFDDLRLLNPANEEAGKVPIQGKQPKLSGSMNPWCTGADVLPGSAVCTCAPVQTEQAVLIGSPEAPCREARAVSRAYT